jgi:integrase/recombinase XerD
MGHSSLQTTMIYLHLTETAEASAREVIDNVFGQVPGDNDGNDDPEATGLVLK